MLQLVGALSCIPKGAGSIPSQGTCRVCGFDPRSGCVREAANQCFPPPSFIKKISINIYPGEGKKDQLGGASPNHVSLLNVGVELRDRGSQRVRAREGFDAVAGVKMEDRARSMVATRR